MCSLARQIFFRHLPVTTRNVVIRNVAVSSFAIRHKSTSKPIIDLSLLDSSDRKILEARQLMGINKLPNYIIRKSSVFLYEACTDRIDIELFMNHLKLEDTFNTWFCVTRLHVWIVLTRCMKERKFNGETLRNEVVARMWEDTTERVNKLGSIKSKVKRNILKNYYDEFNATILSLDEGLLSDDTILAGALWRNLFGMNKDLDAVVLELMIRYVRAQVDHLDRYCKTNEFVLQGKMTWKPFEPLIPTL